MVWWYYKHTSYYLKEKSIFQRSLWISVVSQTPRPWYSRIRFRISNRNSAHLRTSEKNLFETWHNFLTHWRQPRNSLLISLHITFSLYATSANGDIERLRGDNGGEYSEHYESLLSKHTQGQAWNVLSSFASPERCRSKPNAPVSTTFQLVKTMLKTSEQ